MTTISHDYHYKRNGTVNLFTFSELLAGRRVVLTRERYAEIDWTECVREALDTHCPNVETVVLVMDNLNTHGLSSLYEAFAPAEAQRLARRLEIHYTPEHGSWLNVAEIEQSVMARQALSRHPRPGGHGATDDSVARAAQRRRRDGRLAVHH